MAYYKKNNERHISVHTRQQSRIWGALLSVLTLLWVYILNTPIGALPPLGKILDPQSGCMANAEPVKKSFDLNRAMSGISKDSKVWYDDRLVPHIQAANDHDLYYIQGYVHATFRLWQMDMQTRAAAGRLSEVAGEKTFEFDRKQRRKGMVYAAENSLRAAEDDPRTKEMLDAYTAGINAVISSLSYSSYPIEYKLMNFVPEPWSNIKSILLMKYMADDLTGKTDDIAHSYFRTILLPDNYNNLFPDKIAGSTPVIPEGTHYPPASLPTPVAPQEQNAFPAYKAEDFGYEREEGKGSNNWAVRGTKTKSGVPILCNDPHLALNLPSLWYEVQLQTPDMNVYGASLPGAPGVVIGFNDHISWGLTNNYRDVKDYYEIKTVKGNPDKYWFSDKQVPFKKRIEHIQVKGQDTYADTVRYTLHGPLIYDEQYNENGSLKRPLAVCWMGHKASNEMLAVYMLNRAAKYNEFTEAIQHFECPAQNMIYADKAGNIALWGQGRFVNKWYNQGEFVMNGWDSSTLWGDYIPMNENPHAMNPEQGFLSSANQCVTDSTYPYWYNGDYSELRAWRINQALSEMSDITVSDMFALQNDDYSILAGTILPVMLGYCQDINNNKYLDTLRNWDGRLTATSMAGTIFQLWWRNVYLGIWNDDLGHSPDHLLPLAERTMQLMITDTTLRYYDDRATPEKETLRDIVRRSLTRTTDSLTRKSKEESLEWYLAKNTSVTHLAKIPAFSFPGLKTGGWGNTVNAMKGNHGPSWRMVVQMSKETEAWGVYPGGQSGNPGSRYYATFLPNWVEGKYYRLLFLSPQTTGQDARIIYTWNLKPAGK